MRFSLSQLRRVLLLTALVGALAGCQATGSGFSGGDLDGECEDLVPSCDGDDLTTCEQNERVTRTCVEICETQDLVYLDSCSFDPERGRDVCWCG